MLSPFPGMDPYLEEPRLWPGVHLYMIGALAELLNKRLRPNYVVDVEERIYLSPDHDPGEVRDDETHERRLEIRTRSTGKLVTVIEVLSPANKTPGAEGQRSFLAKRDEITSSKAHWVEIDLLRAGQTMPVRKRLEPHEYCVHVSPVELRPKGRVWPIRLQSPLPVVGIPLRKPDADAPLDLQKALEMVYDRGAYDLKLDYTKPPVPALPPALARWPNKMLKQKKLR